MDLKLIDAQGKPATTVEGGGGSSWMTRPNILGKLSAPKANRPVISE